MKTAWPIDSGSAASTSASNIRSRCATKIERCWENYFADLLGGPELIVELKACRAIADEHVAQLLGYLRASRKQHGMLIDFGSSKLDARKFVLSDCG